MATQCFDYGNGRFGHPEEACAISLREATILEIFPKNYRFLTPGERVSFSKLGSLIGNAVPVQIGEVLAQSLLAYVQKYHKQLK
ncbi:MULTISPECIES: DNA cytosine methyltransferase [unclassified Microcoleus]|uniref:DNA cytosine methyltransferase n=1 Tax=unclassified Microcoleus TaxID=2642155 RepID=UPI00403F015A